MNARFVIKNMSIAFIAQGVSLAMGVLQSLLVPKLLGITQYGYWQLFIFYTSYVGFFHLGLNDGVYLIFGGKSRKEIDKRLISSQFIVAIVFQSVVAVIVSIIAIASGVKYERAFVLIPAIEILTNPADEIVREKYISCLKKVTAEGGADGIVKVGGYRNGNGTDNCSDKACL